MAEYRSILNVIEPTASAAGAVTTKRSEEFLRCVAPKAPTRNCRLSSVVEHFHGKEGVSGSIPEDGSETIEIYCQAFGIFI